MVVAEGDERGGRGESDESGEVIDKPKIRHKVTQDTRRFSRISANVIFESHVFLLLRIKDKIRANQQKAEKLRVESESLLNSASRFSSQLASCAALEEQLRNALRRKQEERSSS